MPGSARSLPGEGKGDHALTGDAERERARSVIDRVDFHLYSYYSACGKRDMVPAAVVAAYRDTGYTAIGFTDHLPHYLRFFCAAVRWPGVMAVAHPIHTNVAPRPGGTAGNDFEHFAQGNVSMAIENPLENE